MADGHFPTLVSATRDANAVANPIFTKISDGTDMALVDGSGNLNVVFSNTTIAVTATNLDIRDLTHVSDSVKVGDGTDFLAIAADGSIAVTDNGSSLTVDGSVSITGSVTVTATDLDIRNLTFATDKVDASGSTLGANSGVDIGDVTINNAAGAAAVNIQDGGNSITVDGSVTVSATNLDIRDLTHVSDSVKIGDGTDFLAVNANGSINVVVAATAGAIVHSYEIESAVASDATANHNVTAGAAALEIKSVSFASSGASKCELIIDPTGTPIPVWTGFVPKEGGVFTHVFELPVSVPTTIVARLVLTNRQGQAQDLYSTIEATQL